MEGKRQYKGTILLMPFNEKLQALRKAAGLTQEGLARKAGLSTSAVVKLEQPNKEPVWTTAVKLADALGVSLDAFKDGADLPAPEAAPAKKRRGKKGA